MSDSTGTPRAKQTPAKDKAPAKKAIKRAGADPKTTEAKAPIVPSTSPTTAKDRPKANPLLLPGSAGFKDPRTGAGVPDPTGDFEAYPSELNKLKSFLATIQNKYGFKPFTDSSCTQFENEVKDRAANEIGLVLTVHWKDVDVDDDPNSDTLYWIPTLTVIGRTEANAPVDHDQLQAEIRSGELDGQAFVIREDGSKSESARRTVI